MESYFMIATLNTSFSIRTLILTDDNDYLVALGKDSRKKVAFWPLEKNEDSFRINVSLKGITNCYVTPSNEYMATMNENTFLAIWNIQSRT